MNSFFFGLLLVVSLQASAAKVMQPEFDGKDVGRQRIKIGLTTVLDKLVQPTDIQFLPGSTTELVVCEKMGRVRYFDLKKKKNETIGKFKVHVQSEMGVLGFTFHPKFPKVSKVYLNYNPEDTGPKRTRISEFQWVPRRGVLSSERVLLEVEQPFPNHKAGQLAFGPDGMLYIGLGDGGSGGDPHGNGQNLQALLGKMLRINVDKKNGKIPYSIPSDNPFVGREDAKPEIYAYGIRNPWRYSFDTHNHLVTGDVGQNLWEEISFIPKGANLGWKIQEAFHCFDPVTDCKTTGLTLPITEYGRDDGASITGGYVYTGNQIPELKGKYIFGDFVTGRLWSITLPIDEKKQILAPLPFEALGRWAISPATFGRDAAGEIYVADFAGGEIHQLVPVR